MSFFWVGEVWGRGRRGLGGSVTFGLSRLGVLVVWSLGCLRISGCRGMGFRSWLGMHAPSPKVLYSQIPYTSYRLTSSRNRPRTQRSSAVNSRPQNSPRTLPEVSDAWAWGLGFRVEGFRVEGFRFRGLGFGVRASARIPRSLSPNSEIQPPST